MRCTLFTLFTSAIFTEIQAGVSYLQVSTQPLVATSASARHSEEEEDLDQKSPSGDMQDDDDDIEVIVRHHPARRPALYRQKPENDATKASNQYHSALVVNQPSKDRGPSAQPLPSAPEQSRPLVPLGATPALEVPRGHSELIIGVLMGIVVCLLILLAWLGCWPRKKAQSVAVPGPALPPDGLDGGRLGLVQFHYQGAFFNQLSWTFERGRSRQLELGTSGDKSKSTGTSQRCAEEGSDTGDREGDCVTMVRNERSQKVAHGIGRLMSTPNGEIHLTSLGAGTGGLWCMLKRPAPSRRPGQFWDFKVCKANGVPYAEVRQRSETKCLINDAATQRRLMTVIGNFTYPVFLSGERSIHVWVMQADGQSCMGAQCEAKLDDAEPGAQYSMATSAAESTLPAAHSRRFYVTTTAHADASLVLAVLLGLQDVHQSARRGEMPEMPEETSSVSTSSARGRGARISSGGSTAATSAATSRRMRFESAKAAPYPP